jgi:RNA-directed DNA polymerase
MPQDAPPNGGAPVPAPVGSWSRVAGMQAKLHHWAAADPGRRFDDLFNFVHDPATLIVAFDRVAGNRGANTPGADGMTVALVEERIGVPGFLDDLRAQLKSGTFRPLPVRERKIPKPGGSGKLRKLGIPAVADKVVQAALKLVLEPIFEADFEPVSYGFRPVRRAHDAIAEIHQFGTHGYRWVLDADIEAAFDNLAHSAVMARVRARVKDKRVLGLVKAFLKAGILTETGYREDTHTGTPQGGIITPPTQLAISASRSRWVTGGWSVAGERRAAGGAGRSAGVGSGRVRARGGAVGDPGRRAGRRRDGGLGPPGCGVAGGAGYRDGADGRVVDRTGAGGGCGPVAG